MVKKKKGKSRVKLGLKVKLNNFKERTTDFILYYDIFFISLKFLVLLTIGITMLYATFVGSPEWYYLPGLVIIGTGLCIIAIVSFWKELFMGEPEGE